MRRTTLLATLALALQPAVPAHADHVRLVTGEVTWLGATFGGACRFYGFAQETVTGGQDTVTGIAVGVGYEYQPPVGVGNVDVHCSVQVNGGTVDEVSDGQTTGIDVAVGQMTYTADATQVVRLCVGLGGGHGGPECEDMTVTPVPPREVEDAVASTVRIVEDVVRVFDPTVCPVLASLSPGIPGVVDVASEGDVYVLGERVRDCPPYES